MFKARSKDDKPIKPAGDKITPELVTNDAPSVSVSDNNSDEANFLITIDKADNAETIYADCQNSDDDIIDVSSSSFDVSASVDSESNIEATESIVEQPDEIDATYTIINDNNYAQPEAPTQPTAIAIPQGHAPVAVEPMIYSSVEASAPEKSLPTILLASLLLGISMVGGVVLTLVKQYLEIQ